MGMKILVSAVLLITFGVGGAYAYRNVIVEGAVEEGRSHYSLHDLGRKKESPYNRPATQKAYCTWKRDQCIRG